ncbi:MAG: CbiX/SirB N-terminal domain-containing protein, partial [cyanobacterium endosymbiont of Rhopalodia inflata]
MSHRIQKLGEKAKIQGIQNLKIIPLFLIPGVHVREDIAEEVAISKNLELLGYAGGRLHFAKLSTAKSIDLIRSAKKKGLNVSCDIAAYQPLYTDEVLNDFDTNYKVNPPLREKVDQDALIKG